MHIFTTKESTNILNTFKTSQNYTMFSYNSTTSTELLTTLQILFHRTSQDFHNTSKLFLIPQNSKKTLHNFTQNKAHQNFYRNFIKTYQNFSKLYTTLQNFTNFTQLHKFLPTLYNCTRVYKPFFLQYSAKI